MQDPYYVLFQIQGKLEHLKSLLGMYSIQGRHDEGASATVTISRALLLEVIAQVTTFVDELAAGRTVIDGDASALMTIFGNLDTFATGFAIVEPYAVVLTRFVLGQRSRV